MTVMYVCDICNRQFHNKKECIEHEERVHNKKLSPEDKVRLKYKNMGKTPCAECKYSYYVYGIELECEKDCSECNTHNNFKLLEVKD